MTDASIRALATVAGCADPDKLRRIVTNARHQGDEAVERAASLKLYSVLPSAEPGTLEHDVWRSVFALEDALKTERGKTVLIGRTRQKIARDGECKTVADLVTGSTSDGFTMLVDRDMVDHTFEAVALRHPHRFEQKVLAAAAQRLGRSADMAGRCRGAPPACPSSPRTPSTGPALA